MRNERTLTREEAMDEAGFPVAEFSFPHKTGTVKTYIYKADGKLWRFSVFTTYNEGWMDEGPITAHEVEPYEETVTKYRAVGDHAS